MHTVDLSEPKFRTEFALLSREEGANLEERPRDLRLFLTLRVIFILQGCF